MDQLTGAARPVDNQVYSKTRNRDYRLDPYSDRDLEAVKQGLEPALFRHVMCLR